MAVESRTRSLVMTGLSIALISTGAFITVPFGPVPFTLQTMMLGIVLCILRPPYAIAAVGGYLILGCLGLPVFSGMRGGIAVLAGPTGGFLVGFLVATLLIAFLRSRVLAHQGTMEQKTSRPRWFMLAVDVSTLLIFFVIYNIFGCLWFMISTAATLEAALAASVVPFVLPDILKAAAVLACVQPVRLALGMSSVSAPRW